MPTTASSRRRTPAPRRAPAFWWTGRRRDARPRSQTRTAAAASPSDSAGSRSTISSAELLVGASVSVELADDQQRVRGVETAARPPNRQRVRGSGLLRRAGGASTQSRRLERLVLAASDPACKHVDSRSRSRGQPPRDSCLWRRTSTLPAAEPEAAAPRRLQKSTPPGVSRASAGEQTPGGRPRSSRTACSCSARTAAS